MSAQHIHPEPTTFLRKYWFSTDHKVIARQFLWLGCFFLAWGGMMAMLIRWQLANPGEPFPLIGQLLMPRSGGIVTPSAYTTLFTMHGLIMIFWGITPVLIGFFGNFCIPLMIGARDMAFPTLNMASFHTMFIASVILLGSFMVPMGSGAAGWTTYPPLSTQVGTPGWGQTIVVIAIFFDGVATIMGGINYVTTVIRLRAPGMGYFQMPLTVWGQWLTAILNVLFVPVLGAAALLLILDRTFGTEFYINGSMATENTGDPILFQHLFWIFGHPEVYILILPAWGIISDLLAFFSRKPAYWYKGTALGMTAVTILSAVVYGHHMFVTGMNPLLGKSFMLLTLIISVPAEVFFLNWLHTMWKGSIRWTVPMAFSVGVVFVFGLGGLTGLFLGTISTDLYLHDTYFVVGHFHLTMAAAAFLGSFAGIYFWFPKVYGRMMSEKIGKWHFWLSFITINAVFCGQLVVGWGGMQRRLYDPSVYTFLEHLGGVNKLISYAAFVLGISQLLFVYNFIASMIRGEKAGDNPWHVGTLEWSVPSPPKHYNFDPIPTVYHGPHEYSNPKVTGKDWVGQWEPPDVIGGPPAGEEKKGEAASGSTQAAE